MRPIWPGFAINTIFYAALLWLLVWGPFAMRRFIRRKRGLCVTCGYDLRHADHDACPECVAGATVDRLCSSRPLSEGNGVHQLRRLNRKGNCQTLDRLDPDGSLSDRAYWSSRRRSPVRLARILETSPRDRLRIRKCELTAQRFCLSIDARSDDGKKEDDP